MQVRVPTERRTWLVVGFLVAALAAAVLAARPPSAPVTVHGFVTVYGLGSFERPGDDCAQPLFAGRPVSVFDDDGRTLATTTLTGRGTATDRWHSFAGGFADACRYAITFPDVTAATDSYTLAVGPAPGHGTTVTRAQLGDADVELTYGHA
jgi:hypothetical protein